LNLFTDDVYTQGRLTELSILAARPKYTLTGNPVALYGLPGQVLRGLTYLPGKGSQYNE